MLPVDSKEFEGLKTDLKNAGLKIDAQNKELETAKAAIKELTAMKATLQSTILKAETQSRDLETVKSVINEFGTLKTNLQCANEKIETQVKELQAVKASIAEKDKSIMGLKEQLTSLLEKNTVFQAQNETRPMIKFDELAREFCDTIENLNAEAKVKSTENRPKIMVDNLEVEIKAGIDMQSGIRLTQLKGEELSSQSVSTVKFALKQSPVIKTIDDSDNK
jgi:chromosome segregation ATPase